MAANNEGVEIDVGVVEIVVEKTWETVTLTADYLELLSNFNLKEEANGK